MTTHTAGGADVMTQEDVFLARFAWDGGELARTSGTEAAVVRRVLLWGPSGAGKRSFAASLARLVWPRAPVTVCGLGAPPDTLGWIELGHRTAQTRLATADERIPRELRRALLASAHGVVFVADSALDRARDNAASAEELAETWRELGGDARPVRPPVLLCVNKRDLPFALPVDSIREDLEPLDVVTHLETVAPALTNGELLEWLAALASTFRITPATDPPPDGRPRPFGVSTPASGRRWGASP